MKRIKAVLKRKLHIGNMVKAIKIWAVLVIRCSAGIGDWKKITNPKHGPQDQETISIYQACTQKHM